MTRHLRSDLRNIMAYYDIVGSLPLELLILVVEYLDLEDIVRCQGVRIDFVTPCANQSPLTVPRSPGDGA